MSLCFSFIMFSTFNKRLLKLIKLAFHQKKHSYFISTDYNQEKAFTNINFYVTYYSKL